MNHCRYYLPWITTSQGEIMDVCVDDDRRAIKRCNPEECMLHGENFGQEEENLEYETHRK